MSTSGSEGVRALDAAMRHARGYLAALGVTPVGATIDLDALRRRLGKPLAEHGVAPELVPNQALTESRSSVGRSERRSPAPATGTRRDVSPTA
jgi:hypothetical protein